MLKVLNMFKFTKVKKETTDGQEKRKYKEEGKEKLDAIMLWLMN
jgi:hypothetical protein